MRLLYVSNGSNFIGAGGMEYHLLDVSEQLKHKNITVGFAVRKGTFLEREMLAQEQNLFPMSCTGPQKIYSLFQLMAALVTFNPDIVSINRERDIVQTYWLIKLYNLIFSKKTKIISVFHNLGWKTRLNLDKLDGVIFPNYYIRNEYVYDNGAHSKYKVIYHGIDVNKYEYKTNFEYNRFRKYFTSLNGPIIGMVGEFRKNQIELIDIAIILKRKLQNFTFALVGRGTDNEIAMLTNKIKYYNLEDNFIITGNINRDKMPDLYFDFDISITTNRHEPFGIVFIESLAACTPLVAYNSGGPVEVLANGGGFLVDGGPDEMADRLYQLLSDTSLRCRVGAEARKSAEQSFSIESMGEQHFEFYKAIQLS